MQKIKILFTGIFLAFMMINCSGTKKSNQSEGSQMMGSNSIGQPGPPLIIYRTNGDYFFNVPVILNEDHTAVVSYPDPRDLVIGGNYTYPTHLSNDFLLDNRGINENVAFLKLTYDEYSKLSSAPNSAELMEMVVEAEPLTEMYQCGNRSNVDDPQSYLNAKIENNEWDDFKKLK
ncbi:MAG: hypothetical protein KQI35_07170 [Bacteroidetes bacterium]|nr:hypothetical protein [Bacteroidota bacterium]